ncbi:Retrotransposon gag protein [Artemisia annua]|uniref:Retrotransposon gag protein n=1 Tax=Artemisia annua TaxID=35608 RepID=A0A2U1PJG5_ARTAN|nr:Retrotransposon gag protein [Artemisia annua]
MKGIKENSETDTEINDLEGGQISDAVIAEIKGLVSGEVAQALETLAPTLLSKVTETINKTRLETLAPIENIAGNTYETCKPPEIHDEQNLIISYRWAPRADVGRIRREFLKMNQTTETVSEFTGLFMDRARFCPEYVKDEGKLMEQYKEALRMDIREFVATHTYRNLSELVNAALDREQETQRNEPSLLKQTYNQKDLVTTAKPTRVCETCHIISHDSRDCPRARPAIQPERQTQNTDRRDRAVQELRIKRT